MLPVSPVLHGQAETGRQRRPRRQVPSEVRQEISILYSDHGIRVTDRVRRKASQWGAFFVCVGLFCALPAWARDCPTDRVDERAVVAQVIDGDTLRLRDGRLVRLIGINTPEIGRDGRPSEPFAEQARDAVQRMLGRNAVVGLRLGAEPRDRHGRLLAHVYHADGRSLEAALLTRGLAAQIVVPPNLYGLDCYRAAEQVARDHGRGVWRALYRPQAVESLPRSTRGFRLISGRITSVGDSKYSVWLNFPRKPGERKREGVALRIPRKDLANFPRGFLRELRGRQVVARGWLFRHKKQLVMVVRHPAALEVRPAGMRVAAADRHSLNP
ncbi:MAG TPA: thermonuclease family protein [Gammaproteobacteria bacterium]|nr:thermonuclease family protein [Gammaproteobacteria bacterium]